MGYRYKLRDLYCGYCVKKNRVGCKYSICPYIMDNLADLKKDEKFRSAVRNAERCVTLHKYTLLLLKVKEDFSVDDIPDKPAEYKEPETTAHSFKPECNGCGYGATGFVCSNQHDKSCLVDWIKEIREENYAGS